MRKIPRIKSKHLALLAVVVLAVTAGCLGGGGGDGGEQPADEVPRAGNLDPVDGDVSGDEILTSTVGELESLEQYSFTLVSQQDPGTGNERQSTQEVTIDAVNQEAAVSVSQTLQGETEENTEYLVDGFAYRRSDQYEQETGSAWVKRDVSESVQALLDQYDMAGEVATIFGNATATVEGEATYQGQQVYVLDIDVDEQALEEYYGQTGPNSLNFTNIQGTAWISQESNLPLRVEQVSNSTTSDGTEITVEDTITFDYDTDTVTLPDEAADAPDLADLRNQSGN